MIDDDILKHFTQASADEGFRDAALKEIARECEAKIAAIAGGTFPAGAGETVNTAFVIDAAKTELRRVAMTLHAEARAVLQNVFLCPADVVEAADHLYDASVAISTALNSQTVIDALKLPNK